MARGGLRFVFLELIAARPRHGYELIKAVEEESGGHYAPSPGVAYPALEQMLDLGWVSASESEGRRVFAVTDAGKAALSANARVLENARERLAALREAAGRGENEPGDVRAAMAALGAALRRKAADVELTDADREAIAAALDDARARIQAIRGQQEG